MASLRFDLEDGNLALVTDSGKVITADSVTIRLMKNQAAKIEIISKSEPVKNASYSKFYAHALTREHKYEV